MPLPATAQYPFREFPFLYCCRHTYVSQLQAQGVPLETIQSLTGHAGVDMTEHYLHVQKEVKEDAAQKLNSLFKKGKPALHIA